jgi:predicted cupin superfamily sugar epimerase
MNKFVTDLIASLQLAPHPEGGYYRETYRSSVASGSPARALSTAIYYLLLPDTFSELHRLSADEIFHFYLGQTVELLQLFPNGSSSVTRLGQDLATGEQLQVVVKAGVWFGAKLADGGGFALMGTTVAPGFDFADYERGDRAELSVRYPDCAELIESLTR